MSSGEEMDSLWNGEDKKDAIYLLIIPMIIALWLFITMFLI